MKAKFVVYDKNIPRRILDFSEMEDGTLLIANKSGHQIGLPPDNKVIAENRYSIHPSLDNKQYNTIKNHLVFKGDKTQPPKSYHYTNAIKSGKGFTTIFWIRYSDLKAPGHNLGKVKDGTMVIELGQANLATHTLYLAMLVGHPNAEFSLPDNCSFTKTEYLTAHFRIVILTCLTNMPSIPFAWFGSGLSHGGFFGADWKALPQHCESDDVKTCLELFDYFIERAHQDYLNSAQIYIKYLEDELRKNYIFNHYTYTLSLHKP